jgi:hypothetical protein
MGSGSSPSSRGVFLPLPLLQAFLLLIAGHVPLLLPSLGGLFIYSSRGKWAFPSLLWSFHPTTTFSSFPAPGCWVGAAAPAFSSWLVVSTLQCSGRPTLFATCLFCYYCLLFSFFSFFPGWGLVCPGGYADLAQGCLWKYHVPLSSPYGLCLPKPSRCYHLAAWEPSWFLRLM